ncbi:DNA methyltransferase [Sphingomonas sp. M1-B02]|uniref:DNA methyltransferase n=1 Tax=Sphingomonas sp. M1-B02 TaxID=3114300 RepID=UPI002240CA02|nr:DNA methyltransferase [Sphingomonas sp. S6-11]UZK65972.1 DNA methyltransferase [Sphingomonas sp. S6-11]
MSRLYYGDNLDVLREHVRDESIDLIYLDPPFNSNAGYNVLFKAANGAGTDASIEAFDDTWTWGEASQNALLDIAGGSNRRLQVMIEAMHKAVGQNPLMAYLAMMAVRLVELHRVLKPSGSLYLHCDPTASHYLKLVLDSVFGAENFQNEIVWSYRRWPTVARRFQRMHDIILLYSKADGSQTFNTLLEPPTASSLKRWKGKKQRVTFDVTGKRNPTIEEADVSQGVAMNAVWSIPILAPVSRERLGYPTQKPRALLERIISASSNPGDVVLDPFCGCGTAVDAAQKLGRSWIGIDVTHIAIGMIEDRMRSGYPGIQFETIGVPRDLASAERLAVEDPHQFQQWVSWQVGGFPREKKGGDRGVDGWFNYLAAKGRIETGVISVKAGDNVTPNMVRDLGRVMERDKHRFGLFVMKGLPTKGMRDEAASQPVIETEFGRFPALQFVTLAELFMGRKPKLPPLISPVKKATRVETRASHLAGSQGSLL